MNWLPDLKELAAVYNNYILYLSVYGIAVSLIPTYEGRLSLGSVYKEEDEPMISTQVDF